MIRFQFVDDHRTEYSVKRMCDALKINRSSYYKWKSSEPRRALRAQQDTQFGGEIQAIFDEHDGCYGIKRITAELNDRKEGVRVNHKKVARLMRQLNLRGFAKKRKMKTTVRDAGRRVFDDLVKRDFTADAPNRVYVGDVTYLPVAGGKNLYLATVIDCFSRKLVGFAIADHMRVDLVQEALENARRDRGSLSGAVFHSDHGSVYTSSAFQAMCREFGVTQSMGAVGSSADNSLAESFNATIKREVLKDQKVFSDVLQCRLDVFRWCVRYNTVRRHSWCNYRTPEAFERCVA